MTSRHAWISCVLVGFFAGCASAPPDDPSANAGGGDAGTGGFAGFPFAHGLGGSTSTGGTAGAAHNAGGSSASAGKGGAKSGTGGGAHAGGSAGTGTSATGGHTTGTGGGAGAGPAGPAMGPGGPGMGTGGMTGAGGQPSSEGAGGTGAGGEAPMPTSRVVSLRTNVSGQYVGAAGSSVDAAASSVGQTQLLTLTDTNGGDLVDGDLVTLAASDGSLVSAVNGGGAGLTTKGGSAGDFETFSIKRLAGGGAIGTGDNVAFQSKLMVQFMSALNGGGGEVRCDEAHALSWETFQLTLDAVVSPPTMGAGGAGTGGSTTGTGGSPPTSDLDCPGDSGDPLADARKECVKTINAYRATLGLPPHKRWCGNATCEDSQCSADRGKNQAHSAFGKCTEWGQCECPGWGGKPLDSIDGCLQAMWNEGPGPDGCANDSNCFEMHGHYLIMSSTDYTMVECGFDEAGGNWWSVQDYK